MNFTYSWIRIGSCSISSSMKNSALSSIDLKPFRLVSIMILFLRLGVSSSDQTEFDLDW